MIGGPSSAVRRRLSPLSPVSLPHRQSALYFASFVATGMVLAALGPALSGLARQTGVEINAISILFVAQNLGVLMGTIASGRRFDRWPAHPFMAAMMAIMAITVALAPLPGSLIVLAVVLFTFGLGKGGIDVASNTALVWVQGAGVGPYMNALHFFFGLGALISPTLVAVVLDRTGGVGGAYWLMALAIAPLPFLFLRTPSPAPPPAVAGVAARQVPWAPVVMTATLFFLYVGVEIGYSGLVFSYATRLGLAVTVSAGYLTSLFWACITLGRLLTIPLAARVRPRFLLWVDLSGILVFLTLLAVWPQTPVVVWIVTIGLGFSMASFYPTLLSLAGRHLPLTGRVAAWFMVGGGLGAMIVPWLLGQRFAAQGPQVLAPTLLFLAVLAVVVFAGLLGLFRRTESVAR